MAGRVEQIEAVINTLLARVEAEPLSGEEEDDPLAYADISDIEMAPPALPASTLRFFAPSQEDFGTGGLTQNEWRWRHRTWLDNTDPISAQKEWKRLLEGVLDEFRDATPDDLLLEDGTLVEIRIEDAGEPLEGETVDEVQVYVPALFLIARTEEF